jgi:hypothetical protein
MRILAVGQMWNYQRSKCDSYFHSMVAALRSRGFDVEAMSVEDEANIIWDKYDFCLNIDSGRDRRGHDSFLQEPRIPSAVYFIDTHGQPTLHKRLSRNYRHVFYAVWSRRDVFADHKSAHWCPNFTDIKKFDGQRHAGSPEHDFGFFGSKGGLGRATPVLELCQKHNWSYDIRQIGVPWKHRWPSTQEAMANCKALFNHGQKHDGPNLRVMESMAMCRPLITDVDPRDGMDKLFEDGVHYIGYDAYTYEGLEKAMNLTKEFPEQAMKIAEEGYMEVRKNHSVGNRIDQIIEVIETDLGKTGPCHAGEYE